MLFEIVRERLDEIEAWTVEKFDLLAELHLFGLGQAIGKAKRVWPEHENGPWAEVRELAGEDDDHRLIVLLSEDRDDRYRYASDKEHFFLAKLYGDAARILREYGAGSCEELPGADQQMFLRWLEVGEGSALSPEYDLNQAVFVPIPQGATDKMLTLLHPENTPEELRESARRSDQGTADLIDIGHRRKIKAMSQGLRAQFGGYLNAEERMTRHLKAALTAVLAVDPGDAAGPGMSDQRFIRVSKEVLTSKGHDRLMSEIEAEFPGWCRECGTMPDRVGCEVCRPGRHSASVKRMAWEAPF